mmetsp:Transcript_25648/g.82298  ORF Transcript_25648/g.82298 Transcript_25648/m.82298 type:complete len:209 (+) Transcript_25648:431-1057(+)
MGSTTRAEWSAPMRVKVRSSSRVHSRSRYVGPRRHTRRAQPARLTGSEARPCERLPWLSENLSTHNSGVRPNLAVKASAHVRSAQNLASPSSDHECETKASHSPSATRLVRAPLRAVAGPPWVWLLAKSSARSSAKSTTRKFRLADWSAASAVMPPVMLATIAAARDWSSKWRCSKRRACIRRRLDGRKASRRSSAHEPAKRLAAAPR